ncbi:DEAD-box ATP-dependent RNA helicase 38-like [Helianthus annuus]|uniref:DEAD-box ATP-dependent RNA helicase 38-like n=1 Tax=Helianthus annuus TaxID=4232 RepID=UPI000B8F8CA0|nr:DEAD-box ATP-dependent RNA helicase 38-like [Helianthus annuus]
MMRFYKVNLPDEQSKITVIRDKILALGEGIGQTIIFVRSKRTAPILHEALAEHGYAVTLTQGSDRDKLTKDFNDGSIRVLISTDVVARDIDQSKVNLVVNYDLPVKFNKPTEPYNEIYLLRTRFSKGGAVFNLLCGGNDNMIMQKIETHFSHINVTEVPSWNSDDDFKDALEKAGLK